MIELSRRNIRAIRTTIRQSLGIASARRAPVITLRATAKQLQIQAATETIAIECRLPGSSTPECFAVPYEAMAMCEGKQDDPVSFTRQDDTVIVQWTDKGIPQTRSFPATESVEMPTNPAKFTSIDRRFLTAMAIAVATTDTDTDSSRFALNCVRLRGSDGQIAATDSSQAFIETGFAFPWQDAVLIPASAAFTSNDFSGADDVLIGRTEDWVSIQVNSRTLHLKIDKERRFPSIDLQIPTRGSAATTLVLADEDVDFLVMSTKRLPAVQECNAPVTVDLNGVVAVRAAEEDHSNLTELVLSNSRRIGDEILFNTNRNFLNRAAELGFREVYLRNAEAPAYCQDDNRTYVWALLGAEGALHSDSQTTRISSPVTSNPQNHKPGTQTVMTTTQPTSPSSATPSSSIRP
ncbi:MAG TPA: hypothetical protein PLR25_29615, partial [Planctomycetaceae bacterium]|nr:hypothetical protein [Planctomycetaceae bacterium]